MERKGGSTVVVTKEEVTAAFRKATRAFSQSEEKVVRMRQGAGADLHEPLPKAYADNEELADELLLIEMQLMRAWKARLAQNKSNPLQAARVTVEPANATKNKIVRSLRKKKN